MNKNVRYFKLRNEKLSQDTIIKMTTIEADESITLELNFVLYKSGNEYKKYLQSGTNLILALEASFINNKIQLKGGSGRIFEIMDFHISPNELFEFKSLGLFSYFTSYILRELIDKYNIDSNVNVIFTGGPRVEKDKEDSDTYNRMNFTRKLKTYRKLGFKLKKVCKNRYHLQDTPVSKIKNISLPNSIKFYEYALELINDAKEIIPFANEKVKKFHDSGLYNFVDKEILIKDTSVNVKDIVGTSHPNYYKKPWIEVINHLRTLFYVENLKLTSDSDFSIDFYKIKAHYEKGDDPLGVKIVNGKYYISEGNHRTIIAKFLNALELIEDNINGLKYVSILNVNNNEKIKYQSLIRWLKLYYPDYLINFEVWNEEKQESIINNNREIYYIRSYCLLTHYSITQDGHKISNYIKFNDIKSLTIHVKNELRKDIFMYSFVYIKHSIFYISKLFMNKLSNLINKLFLWK